MGKYAIVKNNMVENVIILNQNQIEEFEQIYNAEIVNAIPYGLCRGDMKVGNNWTRNLNGVQTILQPLIPQEQTDYSELRDELNSSHIELEEKTSILEAAEIALQEGVESIG